MAVRRATPRNSESLDNYLKAILVLSGSQEVNSSPIKRVASNALAAQLGVAAASVTNMLQKLAAAADPFVEYERHRGVLLSAAGKRRALEVVRHHRLIETFLYQVLDYPIEEVHDEAERLEHFISERFEERIAAKLGHPNFDPHGHGIPSLEGEMPRQHSIPADGGGQWRHIYRRQHLGPRCAHAALAEGPRHDPRHAPPPREECIGRLLHRPRRSLRQAARSLARSAREIRILPITKPDKIDLPLETLHEGVVFGGGGREHALAWAIARSPQVTELIVAPGNGGIAMWGSGCAISVRCVAVDAGNLDAMLSLSLEERPDLIVIGPEVPLALGLVDKLEDHGLRVFGPSKAAAMLETSKAFAKDFMRENDIPTAAYAVCASRTEVVEALKDFTAPVVVKADGLAAGKGVVICATKLEAEQAAAEMFSGSLLGAAVDQVVLEEFLDGEELSFFAVCDGKHAVPLAAAQDHKRIGEGDTGPNTGGMGAYSTDALMSDSHSNALRDWLTVNVAQRVVDGMAAAGTPFKGILFCGIMLQPQPHNAVILSGAKNPRIAFGGKIVTPMVLEFNTRFGDPETQALILRLDHRRTDIIDIFQSAIDGTADQLRIAMKPGASVCVIAASQGYPGKYPNGRTISGLSARSDSDEVMVFHSGTAISAFGIATAGGRVLGVTARAGNLRSALDLAYGRLAEISFEGMQYRRDIGWRALR